MRLRKLHIKGFKSFADDTVLNFDEQVIGVVGPNGSGKSNVVDAIRWVLGEQKSKELRLESMTDVIFNGAESRKKSGLAQVSLTFDNTKNVLATDYDQVTVSRLLYRSGESEYRLNDVACRLKDIKSLFIDTGIGSNSYAIIALGMVDDILADKEKARRKMFEQAAGISKFKVRKKETLNKLRATTSDLDRIEDLLYELEQNLKTLEKQAKRARKYYEIKDEYQKFAIHAAHFNIEKIRKEKTSIDEKIKTESDKAYTLSATISKLEAEVQNHKSTHLKKEMSLSSFQKELNNLINSNRDLEREKGVSKDKLFFNTNLKSKAESELENYNEDLKRKQDDVLRLGESTNSIKTEIEAKKNIYEALNDKYKELKLIFEKAKNEFNRSESQKNKIEEKLYSFEKDKAIKQNQVLIYATEEEQLKEKFKQKTQALDKIVDVKKEIDATLLQLEKNVHSEKAGVEKREEKLNGLRIELREASKMLFSIQSKIEAQKHEKGVLQNMIDKLEGFPASIKFISEQKDIGLPLLADLLVVDDEIRGGVEDYLDAYLNYFVAQDIEEATEMIYLLRDAQMGKASFFLLDSFDANVKLEEVLPENVRYKSVFKYLQFEEKYASLFTRLFRNVFVYDGALIDISGDLGDKVILSNELGFIRKEHSVSGGSVSLFEGNKLGRKSKLAQLEKNVISLESTLNKQENTISVLESEVENLKNYKSIHSLPTLQNQLNKNRNEEAGLIVKVESLQSDLTQVDQRRKQIDDYIISHQKELKQLDENISLSKIELKTNLATPDIFGGDINELSQKLSKTLADLNASQIEIIRIENDLTTKDQAISFKQSQLSQLQRSIAKNVELINDASKTIIAHSTRIEDVEKSLQLAYREQKDKEKELNGVEEVYFKARAEINEKEDALRNHNRNQGNLQSIVNELKENRTNRQFQLNAIYERLKIEFGIDKTKLVPVMEELTITPDEVILKVEKIKKRIENYGEINPMAMEAFEEMQERFIDITNQRDDILEAKVSLLSTIEEIETTASLRFMESFNQIRTNFKEVFRSLFTENDDCDLVLMNAESPLEADIEIIAKPKGKKPISLSQLSGGEKTLTAIALLFALYLLKPAPFCIFDEVDAPLDDTNIQKFNKIIKKFSDRSQFIVVTHNKLTMAEVDTLYGVFMQEKGVSGLSQVDLRSFEHEAEFQEVS